MDRINRIIRHPLWIQSNAEIRNAERSRIFCHHDTVHFLDVARLAYIEALEQNLPVSKEYIYAAALLHDIGRGRQYADGTPHDEESVRQAEIILTDSGFTSRERAQITAAIAAHRRPDTRKSMDLAGLLYRADKASRMCLFCDAQQKCNWDSEKKNLSLKG